MKTIAYVLGLFICLTNAQVFAQDEPSEVNNEEKKYRSVHEGEFMVTLFGSYPNFGRYLAQISLMNNDINDYSTGGVAPIGFQLEYMLSNNIAFTMDGIYNSWNASWRHTFMGNTYANSVSQNRYRLLFGLNWHFDELDNDRVNFYAGGAVGMNRSGLSVDVDDYWGSTFWTFYLESPLAFRARAGLRFFIKPNWAANIELGAGGPLLRFGVCYRFINNPEFKELRGKM